MERGEGGVQQFDVEKKANYTVEANPRFSGYQSMHVTERDETKPWKPAKTIEVTHADGTKESVDAMVPAFMFTDRNGDQISVQVGTVEHIDNLHFKGEDLGSRFQEPDIQTLFADAAKRMPEGLVARKGIFTFDLDMGKEMGKEGLASLEELVNDGVVRPEDVALIRSVKAEVQALNKESDSAKMRAFVEAFSQQHPDARIQFSLIREDRAIVPTVSAPKRSTSKLFVMMGPDDQGKTTLFTMAPGRDMPRHPIRGQHTSREGQFDEATFQQSADAWFETVMLSGK